MQRTTQGLDYQLIARHGRTIKVFAARIPRFFGDVSPAIYELAAQRAYERGWRKVVITALDNPMGLLFEGGYCFLAALNADMYHRRDSMYRDDQLLCRMDDTGEQFVPAKAPALAEDDNWF